MGIEINKVGGSDRGAHESVRRSSVDLGSHGVQKLHHEDSSSPSGELAGVYLGILNLYTTLPQFIGTFISFAVFSLLEPGKSPELAKEAHADEHHSTDGPNAIAVCLFIGALAAAVAAYATNRLKYIS